MEIPVLNAAGATFAAAALLAACESPAVEQANPPRNAEYAGVYVAGPLLQVEIDAVDGHLAAVPPFWGGRPYLAATESDPDVFEFVLPNPEPERTIAFARADDGSVESLVMTHVEERYDGRVFERLSEGATTPAAAFMDGRPEAAAEAALADDAITVDALRAFAFRHLVKHPTRFADLAAFLERVRAAHPDLAGLAALHAYALVALDRRDAARATAVRALDLEPDNRIAREIVRRLDLEEPPAGEGYRVVLPFRLADAYAPPTTEEIAAVRGDWATRDLSARGAEIVRSANVTVNHVDFEVRIVRHQTPAGTHYGAVWTPRGDGEAKPVILDVRGVDVWYSPLDVSGGTELIHGLGAAAGDYVFFIPALEGNTLVFQGDSFVADGDPSDAWDGATDSALAFLNAALEIAPGVDAERIAVHGHSRGGTVALLAGARDARISLVLNVAGPVDHFEAMQPVHGFRWAEILADDMSDGEPATLEEDGGQVFDHFFDRVPAEGESLADARRRMIASSPLYFVESLPETYAWYGAEDRAVPRANAIALRDRLGDDAAVRVFAGRGHDTDPYLKLQDIVRRLERWSAQD